MTAAEELLKRVAERLEALGYTKEKSKKYGLWDYCPYGCAVYRKPERDEYFYYGTYLNGFSCLDYDEEPGKVYLWSDEVGLEGPGIFLNVVYKHNGAKENTSVDMSVIHRHFKKPNFSEISEHDKANPIFMRELAKSPKPISKTAFVLGCDDTAMTVRLRGNPSDRVVDSAVRKAVAAFDAFVPNTHDDQLNRADFPADSTEEHFAWETAWKARHGR